MVLTRKKAVTLTELIAGTIIFGIVIVGVTSVDFAMRRAQQSTSQKSLLAMQTSAMMLHITKNIETVTGFRNDLGNEIGIVIDPTAGSEQIWLRIENTPPTPGNYADDPWVSYEHSGDNILFCQGVISPNPCPPISEIIGTVAEFTPVLVTDDTAGIQNFYVEITLINRANPAQPENPFENPEYTLTSRTHPASSSF